MLQNTKKSTDGFTIIEVMIVLAIGGLIMLIVLLAVPALQRSSRNTSRKNDVARISTAVNEWMANNNGKVLTAGTGNANLLAILSSAGDMGQYDLVAGGTFTVTLGAKAAMATLPNIVVVTGAKCDPNTAGATMVGTPRQVAVQSAVETSGDPTAVCRDI